MTLLQDVRKDAQYLENNITGGNFSPTSPKYEAAVTDAQTLIRNLRRLIFATHPPATIDEQLSYTLTASLTVLPRAIALLMVIVAAAAGFGLGLWLAGDSWVEPFDVTQEDGA